MDIVGRVGEIKREGEKTNIGVAFLGECEYSVRVSVESSVPAQFYGGAIGEDWLSLRHSHSLDQRQIR